ncbi:MAG: uroporphyrinogen decarboxylase family protein [Kiritimatiellae bacterium]|nr:uroporphyrinogen decarboxylase family protein [Kiritimatiellia bacterium]
MARIGAATIEQNREIADPCHAQADYTMKLSPSFQIDPREPWVEEHNREVREVWDAYKADRPTCVPVIFTGARTLYLEENRIDYRTYYENPDEMLRLQLEWQRRAKELPFGDTLLAGTPATWSVYVDFHPVASASCFGCPVVFRPDAVPAHECAHLSREQCRDMPMPDLFTSGLLPRQREFMDRFDRICNAGLTFLGKPVKRFKPSLPSIGGGTFSTALDIRGPEIMADMYEDPDFVHTFLERIEEWHIALHRAWSAMEGVPHALDTPDGGTFGLYGLFDHGIDMLSPQIYDEFLVALILKLSRKYGKRPSTSLHHCGRGTHLFPLMQKRFGLTAIDALTWPINDVGKVRREIGYEVWIKAVISDSILRTTPDAIRQAAKDFFTPEVKGKGRLSLWVAGEVTGIPAENYRTLYAAVREYGRY